MPSLEPPHSQAPWVTGVSEDPPLIDTVVVVVPVRDEADRVGDCLRSIAVSRDRASRDHLAAGQRGRRGPVGAGGPSVHVVVVDDGSVDGTGDAAGHAFDELGLDGRVMRVELGQASGSRAAGIAAATRWGLAERRTWVLSTDGDCEVPPDWIRRHLAHAQAGAVAVAGVVSLIEDPDSRAIAAAWADDYGATLRQDGTHPHVHAANLGVRLDVYLDIGGFAPLDRAEDIDLWNRLRAAGIPVVADANIVVATSARMVGRVTEGFAGALRRLYGEPAGTVSA